MYRENQGHVLAHLAYMPMGLCSHDLCVIIIIGVVIVSIICVQLSQ